MVNKGTLSMRKAWYAGTWYTAEPDSLRSTIIEAVDQARKVSSAETPEGPVRFAVLPHAGLAYSGRGIAHLVLYAPKKISRVLILSPAHSTAIPDNTLSFGQFAGFDTPLGRLGTFKTGLESQGPDVTTAIQREHAVEMVLPFLAYLQERQKHPIEVGMALVSFVSDAAHAKRIAGMVIEALGEEELEKGETLVIASSDFTHYGHRFGYAPYGVQIDKMVAQKVMEEDLKLAKALARSESGPVFLRQRIGRSTVCGIAAAAIVSALAKQVGTVGWVADYYNSLDVLKERSTDFVAYGTILWR